LAKEKYSKVLVRDVAIIEKFFFLVSVTPCCMWKHTAQCHHKASSIENLVGDDMDSVNT